MGRGQDLVVRMSIYCRDTLGVESSSIYLSVPVHIENLDPAAGGLRQLDPTAFSVCAVLENAPSARKHVSCEISVPGFFIRSKIYNFDEMSMEMSM